MRTACVAGTAPHFHACTPPGAVVRVLGAPLLALMLRFIVSSQFTHHVCSTRTPGGAPMRTLLAVWMGLWMRAGNSASTCSLRGMRRPCLGFVPRKRRLKIGEPA